jgi:hypothetical protein
MLDLASPHLSCSSSQVSDVEMSIQSMIIVWDFRWWGQGLNLVEFVKI